MLYALVTLFELFRNVDVSYDRTCDKLWEKGNIGGKVKEVLLTSYFANTIGELFDTISNSAQSELSVAASWLGIIAYTFQIYFDFSGYSDMAIGLGKMFGFDFLENFNYPYISTSIMMLRHCLALPLRLPPSGI